jgi:putative membrane protein insertion efficiency factor
VITVLTGVYRYVLRPIWPGGAPAGVRNCRFEPTCSAYAAGALRAHGPIRGTYLAIWRLLRCNPWNPGGHDPVPPR